jgi:hypothetical protein
MSHLLDYIEAAGKRPWVWGQMDCVTFACGWIRRVTGSDPSAGFRGRYSSADEARELQKEEGGFVFIVRHEFERIGLVETMHPESGDVGLVNVPLATATAPDAPVSVLPVVGAVLAIRLGSMWAVRGARGVKAGEFSMLRAWSVGEGES